ncbi:MAG: D-Ala-D-Ala carboxypeptidase family metallohydrolase [Geminicoccaceae bacterium]
MRPTLFKHYSEAAALFARWPNFRPFEIACHAVSTKAGDRGSLLVVPEALDRLQALRTAWGKPLTVVSGYRTPEHNMRVSTTGSDGPHTKGVAFDIRAHSQTIMPLAALAMRIGFTGFGFAPSRGFLHIDTLQPRCWTY